MNTVMIISINTDSLSMVFKMISSVIKKTLYTHKLALLFLFSPIEHDNSYNIEAATANNIDCMFFHKMYYFNFICIIHFIHKCLFLCHISYVAKISGIPQYFRFTNISGLPQ